MIGVFGIDFLLTSYATIQSLLLTLWQPTNASAQEQIEIQTYNFAVFAFLGKELTEQKYQPIIDYLNETLQEQRIELMILPQEQIEEKVSQGRQHFRARHSLSESIRTTSA